MAGNLTIFGGNFQDAEAAPLDAGYLLFELSHDEQYTIGSSQIVAGLKFRITLDSNGDIPLSPAVKVYSNDVMLPSGSFYIVRAFKSDGTEAWGAPQYWQLTASPNPLDVGTIVPANPPGSGLSGSGGATLLLQTNEANNGDQSLLDLHAGTGITLTDNGSGRVTIDGPTAVTLKTNNVNNASQTILNLTNGSGIAITDAGSGVVSIASTSAFSSAGASFFTGGQSLNPPTGAGSAFNASANQIRCCRLILANTWTINTIVLRVQSGSAGVKVTCAIYDSAGTTKVLDAGANAFDASSGATNRSVTLGSPVVLAPGSYWFAYGATNTGAASGGSHVVASALWPTAVNAISTIVGTAANAISSGAMPSSLGVISADTSFDLCAFVFMP